MRECLLQLAKEKRQVAVNFPAAAGGKLVSVNGSIGDVGNDYFILLDIYGNTMIVPIASVSYIEIKK